MMSVKHVVLILVALLILMAVTVFALLVAGGRTKVTQPQAAAAPPIPDMLASTPGPDPDLQKAWREAPKLKVYPPNHPEGVEP
jgi:hypothetical protein